MSVVLYIAAGITFVIGFAILASSPTSNQELIFVYAFTCSAVLFSGGAIVASLNRIVRQMDRQPPPCKKGCRVEAMLETRIL